jgi:hypothetical protein
MVRSIAASSPAAPSLLPGLELPLDLGAHPRHRGLAQRGLRAQRLGERALHIPDRQATDEPGDHQCLKGMSLGHLRAEQRRGELFTGAAQLRPGQRDRPGGGLDRHRGISVAHAGTGVLGQRGAGVALPAQEHGHLGLDRGLHRGWDTTPRRGFMSSGAAQLPSHREGRCRHAAPSMGGRAPQTRQPERGSAAQPAVAVS